MAAAAARNYGDISAAARFKASQESELDPGQGNGWWLMWSHVFLCLLLALIASVRSCTCAHVLESLKRCISCGCLALRLARFSVVVCSQELCFHMQSGGLPQYFRRRQPYCRHRLIIAACMDKCKGLHLTLHCSRCTVHSQSHQNLILLAAWMLRMLR